MAATQWFECFLTMWLSLLFCAAAAVFHFRTHALYCSRILNAQRTHTLCVCHLHVLDLGAEALTQWTVKRNLISSISDSNVQRQPRKFTFPVFTATVIMNRTRIPNGTCTSDALSLPICIYLFNNTIPIAQRDRKIVHFRHQKLAPAVALCMIGRQWPKCSLNDDTLFIWICLCA